MREPGARRITKTTMTNAEANEKAAAVAELGAHVATRKARSKKGTSNGRKSAGGGKTRTAATRKGARTSKKVTEPGNATAPRAESKGAKILEMIGRANGATLAEIMKATDWQAHSVRGLIATARKKQKGHIESAKTEAGDRVYRIAW
jgi:Protein of unknown function (DUF3489)